MNETRRAGLAQLAMILEAATGQLTSILDAERIDVQDMPDNIEDAEFAALVLKRPLFDLSSARTLLIEAVSHINTAITKQD